MLLNLIKKLIRTKRFLLFITISLLIMSGGVFYKEAIIPKTRASNITASCRGTKAWQRCYADHLSILNNSTNFLSSLTTLKKIQQIDQKTLDCHFIAHKLAISEVQKDSDRWLNIFSYIDQSDCVNGFIHGALEGKQGTDPNFIISEITIPQICDSVTQHILKKRRKSNSLLQTPEKTCAHSMGHILLVNSWANIDQAIDICQKLPQKLQFQCVNGVFMESFVRDNLQLHEVQSKLEIKTENADLIVRQCNKYQGLPQTACWTESAHFFAELAKNSLTELKAYCSLAPNEFLKNNCYFHGVELIIENRWVAEETLKKICQDYIGNDDHIKLCVNKTLTFLLLSYAALHKQAELFCQNLPKNHIPYCFAKISELSRY